MTEYHVELAAPEGATKQFETFKTLKKAVRWVRADEASDDCPYATRTILDDDGNTVEVNWDSIEYLTRAELEARYNSVEISRQASRNNLEAIRRQISERDTAMIRAGYVPIRVLQPLLRDIRADHFGQPSPFFGRDFGPGRVGMLVDSKYTLEFQGPYTDPGQPPHPFLALIEELSKGARP